MSNEEADAELQEAWGGAGMSAILLLSRDEAVMSHNYERQHKDAGLPLFRVMGTPEPQDKEAVWPPGILGAGVTARAVERIPCEHKALNSNSSATHT
jgi:hypothetical protein